MSGFPLPKTKILTNHRPRSTGPSNSIPQCSVIQLPTAQTNWEFSEAINPLIYTAWSLGNRLVLPPRPEVSCAEPKLLTACHNLNL
jgi:hypothetical protein